MDFSALMLWLLLIAGGIWGFDRAILRPRRRRQGEAVKAEGGDETAIAAVQHEPLVVEYARTFFPVILVVFVLRAFIAEPFTIPSGSMLPSLVPGDYILVNKFRYGIRLPILDVKLIPVSEPHRGDVVVFRYPQDPSKNYIKRVVGIPGDDVVYENKRLTINGKAMTQTADPPVQIREIGERLAQMQQWTEDLGGVRHHILTDPGSGGAPKLEIHVPAGHYFVMGDNRDRSNDSRYWGFVPEQNLIGRAFFIWFSYDELGEKGWIWNRIFWKRIGETIN
jgi:signal peptidase I